MIVLMEAAMYLEHVRLFGVRIADAADGKLKATVPSMPGYDIGSLLLHTGAFCRSRALSVDAGREVEDIDWSDVGDDALAFHRREHERLVKSLEAAEPGRPAAPWGRDKTTRFWFRRSAHELAVHCWDVENAVGQPSPVDASLAADGIDELLEEFGPSEGGHPGAAELFGGSGQTLHLHALDVDGGEWTITTLRDRFEISRVHGKGDVAARGPASDLLLFLWGRVPQDRLEVFGDATLLQRWQDNVRI